MINHRHFDAWVLSVCTFIVLFLLLILITLEVNTANNFVVSTDLWFENILFSVRSPLPLEIFYWITFLGNAIIVIGIMGIVGIALWYSKLYRAYAGGLVTTVIGAAMTAYIMKAVVARVRPSSFIPFLIETSSSFPSWHATAAMALYGFIAYLFCVLFPARRLLVVSIAIIIIGGVGFSRLYLGVHFSSDVYAGYIVGGLWLLIGIAVARKLDHQKTTN